MKKFLLFTLFTLLACTRIHAQILPPAFGVITHSDTTTVTAQRQIVPLNQLVSPFLNVVPSEDLGLPAGGIAVPTSIVSQSVPIIGVRYQTTFSIDFIDLSPTTRDRGFANAVLYWTQDPGAGIDSLKELPFSQTSQIATIKTQNDMLAYMGTVNTESLPGFDPNKPFALYLVTFVTTESGAAVDAEMKLFNPTIGLIYGQGFPRAFGTVKTSESVLLPATPLQCDVLVGPSLNSQQTSFLNLSPGGIAFTPEVLAQAPILSFDYSVVIFSFTSPTTVNGTVKLLWSQNQSEFHEFLPGTCILPVFFKFRNSGIIDVTKLPGFDSTKPLGLYLSAAVDCCGVYFNGTNSFLNVRALNPTSL